MVERGLEEIIDALPKSVMHAMNYLEQQGQKFLVDFGYENAEEKALAHWVARKRKKK